MHICVVTAKIARSSSQREYSIVIAVMSASKDSIITVLGCPNAWERRISKPSMCSYCPFLRLSSTSGFSFIRQWQLLHHHDWLLHKYIQIKLKFFSIFLLSIAILCLMRLWGLMRLSFRCWNLFREFAWLGVSKLRLWMLQEVLLIVGRTLFNVWKQEDTKVSLWVEFVLLLPSFRPYQ